MDALRGAARYGLVVLDEVIGRRRTPYIERVLRRVVFSAPVEVGRNEVDVVRVFGEAAPGVAHVIEVIRADHVPPDAPPVGVTAVLHLLHPKADIVESGDVPARMMEPRAVRLGERKHVMVARMSAVHE